MSENTELRQEETKQIPNAVGQMQAAAPQISTIYVAQPTPRPVETPQRKRMKENFAFFGMGTFLYAAFYAFCMFKNGSGITFPFFVAASLLYLCFSLSKLEITLRRGSAFYMVSMMLLAVSTFCTDDGRIIFFNKAGIFLLMMSLMLNQFYETSGWKLGKYLGSIFALAFASVGELCTPFRDAAQYFRGAEKKGNRNLWYVGLGLLVSVPLLFVVLALLAGADAVFRQMTDALLTGISFANLFNILARITFLFLAAYLMTSFLCRHSLEEKVKDCRSGEPVLAITVTSLLTVVYLLFSGIQILYLFLGKMQLPEGYTYAEYAREGFFQLLAVSILNLIIVLLTLKYFREHKALKVILTVMSLCTFVMIASSALRMIIYIRFYYLTFLRILVLWGLAVLFLLFIGVIVSIFKDSFPLFGYSTVVVTLLYLLLSFSHPDYIIASVNVGNMWSVGHESGFFLAEHHDYVHLSNLNADAAPVLMPYLDELGYDFSFVYADAEELTEAQAQLLRRPSRTNEKEFGYYYLQKLRKSTENFGVRTYNVSRHMALRQIMLRVPRT